MQHFQLLEILAIGFSFALILGFITHRLRLSPIVGYLLAGFLVGPHSPGFVADQALAAQLAEIGVILLMFGVGLHFDLKDLLAVKKLAIPGAVIQSLAATILGLFVALASGLSLAAGLVLGLGVAVASTVVLMRVLTDNDALDTFHGHVAVGWLIVEDIFTVLVLVILPALSVAIGARGAAGGSGVIYPFAMALLKIVILWLLILPIGGRIVPWFLGHVARSRSRELFTLSILVVAIAIATASAMIFGVSVALGAFLAGMVVGKTKVSHQAASDVLPMRDAFAVLFFISVGMLFNPSFIVQRPALVLAFLAIILIAKPLVAFLVVVLLGYSIRTALTAALGLAQIGEFSFILAQQAQGLGLLPAEGNSLLVACALISIAINPLIFRFLNPLERWLTSSQRIRSFINRKSERKGNAANARTMDRISGGEDVPLAIVVGYGPVGKRVTRLLKEYHLEPVVIDLNVDTVAALVAQGDAAVYGEASRRSILQDAGIDKAKYLLVTLPELTNAIAVITTARALNPQLAILVRARYISAQAILEALGVTAISYEEEEVAKAMAQLLLNEVEKNNSIRVIPS